MRPETVLTGRALRTSGSAGLICLLAAAVMAVMFASCSDARDAAGTAEVDGAASSWSPLTVLSVVDPQAHGAVGDGRADDTEALQAAFDSAGDGAVVLFDDGATYRTTGVVKVTNDHVKLWSPESDAGIFADTEGGDRRQALIINGASGVGLFGLRFRSTADRRLTALEDSAVVLDAAEGTEIVGLDISNSASAAVFVFGASTETYVVGNAIHQTWADGVHFTDGAQRAWVWDNRYVTKTPWAGDDGVACVTYGSGDRCGAMEWWGNLHLGSDWGRGLAVVGGEDIDIHHNVVIGAGAAGVLVASEPSYDTSGSRRIRIRNNVVIDAGHAVPHPAILISALDEPITDISVADNLVVGGSGREPFRSEGDVGGLDHRNTTAIGNEGVFDVAGDLELAWSPRRTNVLSTRDVSLVSQPYRTGLYRVQVRRSETEGFEQRFEYVVAGSRAAVERWRTEIDGVAARFDVPGSTTMDDAEVYLVVQSPSPAVVDPALRPVTFPELRSIAGELPELWRYLDSA